jgi:TolB protein
VATGTPVPRACSRQTAPAEAWEGRPALNTEKLLAFVSGSEANGDEIYLMDWAGQVLGNVTNHPGSDRSPVWAPDGQQLAFLSNRNGPITVSCNGAGDECIYELFVVKPDGSGLKQITTGWTFEPAWSPDGRQIAFVRAFKSEAAPYPNDPFLEDIYLVNADGSNLRNLTNAPGFYSWLEWSPDGQQIAFLSGDVTAPDRVNINIIQADGTGRKTAPQQTGIALAWTADSQGLILAAQGVQSGTDYGNDLYWLKADLTTAEQLTFTPEAYKDDVALAPDGRWLAYHSSYGSVCDQIRLVDLVTRQDYFVYDADDVGTAAVPGNTVPPDYSSMGIMWVGWTPEGAQVLFAQYVRYDYVFFDVLRWFTVEADGGGLRELNERIGYGLAVQP